MNRTLDALFSVTLSGVGLSVSKMLDPATASSQPPPKAIDGRLVLGATLMTLGLFIGCASSPEGDSTSRAVPVDYAQEIKPILEANCYSCHGAMTVPSGKLRLDDRDGALEGGRSGHPAIIPGNGAGSPLVIAISGGDGEQW